MGVLIAYSSSAHRNLDLLSTREVPDRTGVSVRHVSYRVAPSAGLSAADRQPCACSTWWRNAFTSSGPGTRSDLGNALRRTAWSRQTGTGCTYAPRPGSVPRGSGTHSSSIATTRSSSLLTARSRHPTQVRSGHTPARVRPDTPQSTSPDRPHPYGARIEHRRDQSCRDLSESRLGSIPRPAPRPVLRSAPCRAGCRSASRSAARRDGRSAPPCRSPGTAGSPAR